MRRDLALQSLANSFPDGIVVGVFQSLFDWMEIRPHPLNYLCTGAMGQASSHALGLALGLPHEKIVVLDGDGSLLMNLGSLVTVANQQPQNFYHFVLQNNTYEVNGNFPIPGANRVKFNKIAKAAGYPHSYSFKKLSQFRGKIKNVLELSGPVFVNLHVKPGECYPRDYEQIHSAQSRKTFREALKARICECN